jgi:LacI family repressor for deo operon, udp, cdd, tsx, nupC, and nupG
MKSKKRTTIYDIAEKLNIAPSSVSRALSNSGSVKESTRKLILKTPEELNYKMNSLASNLRKGQSKTIGVIVPRINQNFFCQCNCRYRRGQLQARIQSYHLPVKRIVR